MLAVLLLIGNIIIPVRDVKTVKLEAFVCDVYIQGYEGDQIYMDYSGDLSRSLITQREDNTLKIIVMKSKDVFEKEAELKLSIKIPYGKELEIETLQGDITLTDYETSGKIEIETNLGDIMVRKVKTGFFKLNLITGDAYFEDVNSDTTKITTTDGDVKLQNPEFRYCEVISTCGDIFLRKEKINPEEELHLQNTSGDITFILKEVPEELGICIDTKGGEFIAQGIPLKLNPENCRIHISAFAGTVLIKKE